MKPRRLRDLEPRRNQYSHPRAKRKGGYGGGEREGEKGEGEKGEGEKGEGGRERMREEEGGRVTRRWCDVGSIS